MAGNAKDPGRSVISKVSAILWSITEGSGHSLTEIAVRSKLPMSTVHRLATELAAWGVLERDKDGRFRAGRPVRALGDDDCPAAVPGTPSNLRDRAAPVMEDLFRATGLPVKAGSLDGTAVAYVEKVSGHVPVSQPSAAARVPAHATAIGKTLMAFSPPRTVNAITARGLTGSGAAMVSGREGVDLPSAVISRLLPRS